MINVKIKKEINDLKRMLMKNIYLHWRFEKLNFNIIINKNFIFNLTVVKEALIKSLKSLFKLFDFDKNSEIILSSITQIIHELKVNNYVEKFISKSLKFAEKLINNNELLFINELFIIKIKNRF